MNSNDNLNETNESIVDFERALLDFVRPPDSEILMKYLEVFADRYNFLSLEYLGTSILGKRIPIVKLGDDRAERQIMYIGAHHGMEWITSIILLRFINEYCENLRSDNRMFNINMKYLYKSRLLCIIPMLNPDGVDMQLHGISPDNPIKDRVISMNGGSENFSKWQANARGVDLNHNYNAGFEEYKKIEREMNILGGAPTKYSGEYPESEPETGALCNYLRFNENIKMILTFHSQGEEIYYGAGCGEPPRSKSIGKLLSKLSGYELKTAEGTASYGGLTDWYVREMGKPSFTIECGKGENPLPIESFFSIYATLREMLFTAPILI